MRIEIRNDSVLLDGYVNAVARDSRPMLDENGEKHFVPLGQGVVDLKACYQAACELEIPYIMYEHDNDWPNDDPFLACEQSWRYLCALDVE